MSGSCFLRTLTDTVFVVASALALAIPRGAAAQTGANVLVVINHASSASETIGHQYAERRGVPEHNLCVLQLPLDESVNREVYDTRIEQPIWSCVANDQAQDRILYIVLTKDVPIRISGTSGRSGTIVPNPYFAGATPSTTVEPFTHRAHDIYPVTWLDGFTLQDAILTYSPNDPLALNNLAYALAVYRNIPEEALPVAHRATVVAREDPTLIGGASIANYYSLGPYRREPLVPYMLDTLAWVQHLLGHHKEAASTIREALTANMHQASAELSAAVTPIPRS